MKKTLSRFLLAAAFCIVANVQAQQALPVPSPVTDGVLPAHGSYETKDEVVRFTALLEPSGAPQAHGKIQSGPPQALLWIESEDFDYLFVLAAPLASRLRLSARDAEAAFADDAPSGLTWDDPRSKHAGVLSDIEVAPDKRNVRAKLTYRPGSGSDLVIVTLAGQRQRVAPDSQYKETAALWSEEASKAATLHQTMRPVLMGLGQIWSDSDLDVKVYDTVDEASYRRWHAPLDRAQRAWNTLKGDLFAPFILMFCGTRCFSG